MSIRYPGLLIPTSCTNEKVREIFALRVLASLPNRKAGNHSNRAVADESFMAT